MNSSDFPQQKPTNTAQVAASPCIAAIVIVIVPGLFDAFDGSLVDTICMILVPLVIVARLVPANVWCGAWPALGTEG